MDKLSKYIKMSETAEEVQEILKDKFDYRKQGYCTQHKCFIDEDMLGYPICPVYWKKLSPSISKQFPIESCYIKKWIGLPYQDQLQKIHFDSLDKSALSEEEAKAAFILASISELKLLALTWNRIYDPFQSYKELWLSLVMMSMFNKRWSDSKGKWVKHQNDWWEISEEFLKEVEEKIDRE